MTKPRYTTDPVSTGDPAVDEWLMRQFQRLDDYWPQDIQSRLEQLETSWPYITGTWPIVDIAELRMITVTFRDSCEPRQAPYELRDIQYWQFQVASNFYFYTESTDSWAQQSYTTSGGFPAPVNGAGSDDGSGKLMLVEDTSGKTWFSNNNGNFWQQKANYGGRMSGTGGEGGVLYSRGNWYIWGRDSATNSARLWKSTNDGDSWTLIKSDYVTNEIQHCAYKRDDDYLCFVSVLCTQTIPGCGVPRIAITTDQGQSFTEVTMASDIVDPRFPTADVRMTLQIELTYDDVHNKWFMGGRQSSGSTYGHILKQNGPDISGWSHTGQGGVGYYGAATYEGNVLFVDDNEQVTRTPDGGDSWVGENPGGGQTAFQMVISVPGKGVYISARNRLHLWNPATGYTVAYEGRFWGGGFRGAVLLADNQADDQYYPPECFPFNAYFKQVPFAAETRVGDYNEATGTVDWFEDPSWNTTLASTSFNPPDYDKDGNLMLVIAYSGGTTKQVQAAVSTDGGRTWTQRGQVLELDNSYVKTYFNPHDQLWYVFGQYSNFPGAVTEAKVFTSDDFGVTWTQVHSSNPSNPSIGLYASNTGDLVFRDNDYWVWQWSEQGSGSYFFLISTDQGRTWPLKTTIDTTGTYPIPRSIRTRSCMCYDDVNNYWYMGTRPSSGSNYGGIIRQPGPNISGSGWSAVYIDGGFRESIAAWQGNVLMTGEAGAVYSEDGGSNWSTFGGAMRGGNYSLSVSQRGGILIGGENASGPFRYTGSGNFIDEGARANWGTSSSLSVRAVMMIDPNSKDPTLG